MRKLVIASLALACLVAAPACKEPDPNKFETHIEKIKDPAKRATGMADLERLVKAVASAPDNQARLDEFAEKVVPVFVEVWDEAKEQHDNILNILIAAGHPAGCPVWEKALAGIDGSAEARKEALLALEGIKKSKSRQCAKAVIEALDKLIADPKFDKGNEEGRLRLEMVETLGVLRVPEAVPVLIKAMEQTKENQPVAVHRAAATALGNIGDPAAVDALITVTFRVPDTPSTSDIGNRSKTALVAIGEPAVPQVLKMLRGEHEEVNKLAAEHGVPLQIVKNTAAGILGAMGAKQAVEEIVAFMPQDDCGEKPKAETDPEQAALRAIVAQALGFIGDERAVDALCSCVHATHNPGDMWPIVEALGRIGGKKATECLVDVLERGEYDPEYLTNSDFRYEVRWEGARFAIMAASPEDLPKVEAAIAAQTDPKVKEKIAQWQPGIDVVKKCKDDKACYLGVLKDTSAHWFAREKAAVELARLAKGDVEVATEIAKAFKVRSPDARVTMALLPAQMLEGKSCAACVEAYQKVLEAEKGTMDAKMQLPVLVARYTMAKLRPSAAEEKAADEAARKAGGAAEAKGG
ncbi:MAG: hypothetical protein D6705_11960 [Deltaproteobacteria bacterium]|nr:MAG: hypothetical protein D6705_11960 [Deltaproteobacteria bacterium]